MAEVYIQPVARQRIREIHAYTKDRFGDRQAQAYVDGLLRELERLPESQIPSVPIPSSFGLKGFMLRYQSHRAYWYWERPGELLIVVSILHAQMDQPARLEEDLSK